MSVRVEGWGRESVTRRENAIREAKKQPRYQSEKSRENGSFFEEKTGNYLSVARNGSAPLPSEIASLTLMGENVIMN